MGMHTQRLAVPASFFRRLLRRGFARDFGITFATNLFAMVLGLATGALAARLLGPDGRGQLAAIQLWGLFLINIGAVGVPEALVYFSGRRRQDIGGLVASAWALLLPTSIFWIAAGYYALPRLLAQQDPEVVTYARIFLLILPLAYVSRGVVALQGIRDFVSWAIFRVHKPIIYAIILVVLGIRGLATPYSLTLALLVSSVAGPPLALYLLWRRGIRLQRPSLAQMKSLLSYGFRSFLGSVPDDLNTRLDQLLIALWLSDTELGLYAVAVSWSLVLGPLVRAVGTVTFPYVAGTIDETRRVNLFASSVRTAVLLITILTTLLILLTPLAFPLIFGADFRPAVPVAIVLLVASNFYSLKLVLSNGIKGLGMPEATAYAEITSLILTVVLLVLFLPVFGIMGAAVISLLAYLTATIILILFVLHSHSLTLGALLVINRSDIAYLQARLRVLAPQAEDGSSEV